MVFECFNPKILFEKKSILGENCDTPSYHCNKSHIKKPISVNRVIKSATGDKNLFLPQ